MASAEAASISSWFQPPPTPKGHGTVYASRFKRVRESIAAMKEIWTKPEAEYHGEFVHFDPMIARPKPVRKPHPPIPLPRISALWQQKPAHRARGSRARPRSPARARGRCRGAQRLSLRRTRPLIAYARQKFAEERYPLAPTLKPVREALAKDAKCTWELLQGKGTEKLRINPRKFWYQLVEVA